MEGPGGRLLYYRECQCTSVVLYSISSIPAQWSPSPHCPTSAVVRPPCPGCCWSPPPTDCTYHRPKVRAPDCRRLWCHCAVLYRVIFFNWSPLNCLCPKPLNNLQHLDKSVLVGNGTCTYKNVPYTCCKITILIPA